MMQILYSFRFWTILFQVTTPKVSQVKDDPESPDMFGLDQVNIVDLDQLEQKIISHLQWHLLSSYVHWSVI